MSGIVPGQTYSDKVTTAGRKDAFHAACVLCKRDPASKYNIDPGERVQLVSDDSAIWWDEDRGDWDGVADPFVEKIERGALFWVFLRPERYTELTHGFRLVPRDEQEPESDEDEPMEDWDAGCRKCNS